MAIDVKIPAVGESITSGTIVQWHQANGAQVQKGDVLLTLETDKVSTELEAEADGALRILVEEGAEVEIGAVVATIDTASDASASEEKAEADAPKPSKKPSAKGSKKAGDAGEKEAQAADAPAPETTRREDSEERSQRQKRGFAAKSTRTEVSEEPEPGTGDGRAREQATKERATGDGSEQTSPGGAEKEAGASDGGRFTRKKMSPLRRKIATHLVQAQQNAAILTTFNECDMTAVMELRKSLQDAFVAKHGIKLGFMSFFIKAVVDALKSVPSVNGRIDGEDMILNHYYDIGVAVGTERGLVVPVIRDCDQKSFAEIEKGLAHYADKARQGKIEFSDLQGGVFTISNGGIYGSLLSTPILNPPQSGILGMHAIQQRPVAVDGQVVIRPMMYLALSYDHRLVDGKEAVTFLVRVKDCLEQPTRLLVEA